MKVQPISFVKNSNPYSFDLKRQDVKKPCPADVFQPSFNGYQDVINQFARKNYENAKSIKFVFAELINAVTNDASIYKTQEFHEIKDTLRLSGFSNLMKTFHSPFQFGEIGKMVKRETDIILAGKKYDSVFDLLNFRRFSSPRFLFNPGKAPHNMQFLFSSKNTDTYMIFGMTSRGDYTLTQAYDGNEFRSVFDKATGKLKRLDNNSDVYSKASFFRKDGSPDVWKNRFLSRIACFF